MPVRLLFPRSSILRARVCRSDGDLLPLLPKGKRIAVLGFAGRSVFVGPAGSGSVVPTQLPSPLSAIARMVGYDDSSIPPRCCASRCTNVSCPAECDDLIYDVATVGAGINLTQAATMAAAADVAIVFVGCFSGEGEDRQTLFLNGSSPLQDELVEVVAAANNRTIVVVSSPGSVVLPWHSHVAAIIANFLPGQEVAAAVADVIFGFANPSGKLPVTFPESYNVTADPASFPGLGLNGSGYVNNGVPYVPWMDPSFALYAEKQRGLGYRWYDLHNVTPAFEFGRGLSYTTFVYDKLHVTAPLRNGSRLVYFTVSNNGSRAGSEVAQLYLQFPPIAEEAPRQLKGFHKIHDLAPSESVPVRMELTSRDFSTWSVEKRAWVVFAGEFDILISSSSRDHRLRRTLLVEQ